MIKPKLKKCLCGEEPEHLVYRFSHGMSKEHWQRHKNKQEIKPLYSTIKKVTVTEPKIGRKKITGELALFKALWASRPHVCQVTGDPIQEFDVWCFMHILSKGAFPAFRLYDRNILIVKKEVHSEYDNGDRSAPMFSEVMALHDRLIGQYYQKTA